VYRCRSIQIRRSQVVYLAVIFAISLGKERLAQVRGQNPRAASSQWVRCYHPERIHLRKVGVSELGVMTITHPTTSFKRVRRRRVYFVDQWSIKHRHQNVVVGLCQCYESWKADGTVGNTVKMQRLIERHVIKCLALMPYGQSTHRTA
jgi:hypothetical protein